MSSQPAPAPPTCLEPLPGDRCRVRPSFWHVSPELPGEGSPAEIFEAFWRMPCEWFEKPNSRRGGWSGVSRHVLENGQSIFLKRLENHCYRDPWRFGRRTPTFRREWRASGRLRRLGIRVPEILLYAEREDGVRHQAIMVSRALDGYRTLLACLAEAGEDTVRRRSLVEAAVQAVVTLHRSGFQHNHMAAKHLLLREDGSGGWETCLVDLEKVTPCLLRSLAAVRDLSGLLRHTPTLLPEERRHLVQLYCAHWDPGRQAWLERAIVRRLAHKGHPEKALGLSPA